MGTTHGPVVGEIHVYPVKGEPGDTLEEAVVETVGLAGDRRKKAAVHVVAADDVRFDTRANLIVSLPSEELASAVGSVLRVGEVELDVTRQPSSCPGVYADVRRPGTVRVGDTVTVLG